jgi:hypothetical protein
MYSPCLMAISRCLSRVLCGCRTRFVLCLPPLLPPSVRGRCGCKSDNEQNKRKPLASKRKRGHLSTEAEEKKGENQTTTKTERENVQCRDTCLAGGTRIRILTKAWTMKMGKFKCHHHYKLSLSWPVRSSQSQEMHQMHSF